MKTLRAERAGEHLADALVGAQQELSDMGRRLRHGTFFAVPKQSV